MARSNGTSVMDEAQKSMAQQGVDTAPALSKKARHASDEPYKIRVEISGVARLLCHAYDVEDVRKKAGGRKGSVEKKTDNVEAYLPVDPDGTGARGFPGSNMKACLVSAGARFKDPSSRQKSLKDMLKAAVFVTPEFVPIRDAEGKTRKSWDGLDTRRVIVQRNAVPRTRPFFERGWKLHFELNVEAPDLVQEDTLREVIDTAGRLYGFGDNRPDFGRFRVVKWEVVRSELNVRPS